MKACSSQRLFAFTILFCTLFFFHAHLIPVEAVVKVNGNVIYGGDHSVLRHIEEVGGNTNPSFKNRWKS